MKIKTLFKTAATLLAVLLAMSMLAVCVSAEEKPTIVLSSAEALPGETVDVTLALENNPGIISLMLDIAYGEGLELTDIKYQDENGLCLFGGASCIWYTEMPANNPDAFKNNPKRLSWAADTAPANITMNGVIATLSFKVPESAEAGTVYKVEASYEPDNAFIFNFDNQDVAFELSNAEIKVVDCRHENPTWTTNEENTEHWQVCENGHVLEATKGAHTGGTATCDKKAVCDVCGNEYGELVAHTLTKVEAVAATETEAGNVEYYKCEACGKSFKDAEGTEEIADVAVAALGHKLTKVEAKAATATEDGNIEYYKCEGCGKYFKDAEGTQEITLADTVLAKTGKPGSPQTGDTSMLVVMSVSMVLAAAAVATAVVLKKKVND